MYYKKKKDILVRGIKETRSLRFGRFIAMPNYTYSFIVITVSKKPASDTIKMVTMYTRSLHFLSFQENFLKQYFALQ